MQRSSNTAAPASHGRRLPTSSAPPGTAHPAPAASGHARAPTRCTRRATGSTALQRRSGGRSPPYTADTASQGRARVEGRRPAGGLALTPGRLRSVARKQPALGLVELQEAGDWQAPTMPAHYARHQLAAPSPSSATRRTGGRAAGPSSAALLASGGVSEAAAPAAQTGRFGRPAGTAGHGGNWEARRFAEEPPVDR